MKRQDLRRREKKTVRSGDLQGITFSGNKLFFNRRRYDIKTLMAWRGWNASQARLLLKMNYDIELIFAAIASLRDKSLNIRETARKAAFDPTFIEAHEIGDEQLGKIEAEPIRAYHPKFIRRRLVLPEDPEHYSYKAVRREWVEIKYMKENNKSYGDLPSIAPSNPWSETRRQKLMRWGKERFEVLEEANTKRETVRKRLAQWVAEGKRETTLSLMVELGLRPHELYPLLQTIEGRRDRRRKDCCR